MHAALGGHLLEGRDQRLGGCRQRDGGRGQLRGGTTPLAIALSKRKLRQNVCPARGAHLPRPAAGWRLSRAPCRPCRTGAAGRWWTGWRQTGRRPAQQPRQHPGAYKAQRPREGAISKQQYSNTALGHHTPAGRRLGWQQVPARRRQADRAPSACNPAACVNFKLPMLTCPACGLPARRTGPA